jgi:hypothetical protein
MLLLQNVKMVKWEAEKTLAFSGKPASCAETESGTVQKRRLHRIVHEMKTVDLSGEAQMCS